MKSAHSLSVSIIAHAIVVLMIGYQFTTTSTVKYGNDDHEILSSYLVTTPTMIAQQTTKTPPSKSPANAHAMTLHKLNKPQQTHVGHQRAAIKGEAMPALIALLHAAIQQTQHYPASAQEMEREGRATVAFTLHRNGEVSDLKVTHSSGTSSLDSAALAAVHDAAPFQHVEQYLHDAQPYQIDVVFSLS